MRLLRVPTRYEGPVVEEFEGKPPRLYIGPDETYRFVCALPFIGMFLSFVDLNPRWWFTWRGNQSAPMCPATDMNEAARIIGKGYRAI